MQYIENRTYDELAVGDSAELVRTLRKADVELPLQFDNFRD